MPSGEGGAQRLEAEISKVRAFPRLCAPVTVFPQWCGLFCDVTILERHPLRYIVLAIDTRASLYNAAASRGEGAGGGTGRAGAGAG
jgi:hypothetical protein